MVVTADTPTTRAYPTRRVWWLVSFALIAVSMGGFFGRAHWMLDLFANFRMQYAVAGLAVLAIALLMRDRVGGVLALILLVPNLVLVAPLFLGNAGTPAAGVDPLRIMNFNVLESNADRDAVFDYLRGSDADVVVLHEVNRWWLLDIHDADLPFDLVDVGDRGYFLDTVTLVRPETVEVEEVRRASVNWKAHPLIDVAYEGQTVSILGIHPASPVTERRTTYRDNQLIAVGNWAREHPNELVIVGDFNASPWTTGYRDFVDRSGMISSIDGAGFQGSWPHSLWILRVPIDHVFHSDGLATVSRELGPFSGSDHAPVIVDIAPAA